MVWVADDEKVVFSIQSLAEIIYIQDKVILLAKVVVFLGASGEGKFSGIFGVGRSED